MFKTMWQKQIHCFQVKIDFFPIRNEKFIKENLAGRPCSHRHTNENIWKKWLKVFVYFCFLIAIASTESKNESKTTLDKSQSKGLERGYRPQSVYVRCSYECSWYLKDNIKKFYKHTTYFVLSITVSASEATFILFINSCNLNISFGNRSQIFVYLPNNLLLFSFCILQYLLEIVFNIWGLN